MTVPLLQGNLRDRLLPAVLGEIFRRGLEGRFEVVRDGKPLLEMQVAAGRASTGERDPIEAVRSAAAAAAGEFHLLPGPAEAAAGAVPLADLIFASARALTQADRLRDALGSLDLPLALTEKGAAGGGGIRLGAEEGFLLSRVDGATNIRQICQISPFAEEDTLRAVFGLTAVGLLRLLPRRTASLGRGGVSTSAPTQAPTSVPTAVTAAARPPAPPADAATEAATPPAATPPIAPVPAAAPTDIASPTSPVPASGTPAIAPAGRPGSAERPRASAGTLSRTAVRRAPAKVQEEPRGAERQRVEQRIRLAERQNHFELLGLSQTADTDEIRQTYYALARQFHPDRFHRPEVEDLHPALERLFACMTQAYQTLIDPESRQEYLKSLRARPADPRGVQEAAARDLARENYRRGKSLAEEAQFVKALPYLQNAVQADATRAEYLEALGSVQALNPRFKAEAEANLKRAIELAPTRPSGHLMLGLFFARYLRRAEAVHSLKQALGWDANCVAARFVLGLLGEPNRADLGERATESIRQMLTKEGSASAS